MGRIDESILSEYKDPDKYIYINDTDPDLQKWRVEMPKCPDWHLIEGFGKAARQQKFKYAEYPLKLKQLEEDVRDEVLRNKKEDISRDAAERLIQDRIWQILDVGREQYSDVIKWIKIQWFHRIYGYWFFNKGKPTYIDGWHYFYLNFYVMEGNTEWDGKPEYRNRDMKWFHAMRYLFTTTETVTYDENGKLIFEEDGTIKMRDVGARTVVGGSCLKGRRVGDSSKTKSIEIELITSNEQVTSGMQADTDETARDLYGKLTRFSFHRLPFFFMPITPNSLTAKQISLRDTTAIGGLQSYMTFRASGEYQYDGAKLFFVHHDETGKTKNANVLKRHEVVVRTLSPGARITGHMISTTTVEELDTDSGKNFEDMTMKSMFEDRGVNGRTQTGLVNIYFSIEESFEGFIDPWGYPIIENTNDPDVIANMVYVERNEQGEVLGVREYLRRMEKEFVDRGDIVGLSSWQRKNPKSFRECFANASRNVMFNIPKIQSRIAELRYLKNKCVRGNFIDYGNHDIRFIPSEQGAFNVSMQMPNGMSCNIMHDGYYYRPRVSDNSVICAADPYKVSKTDSRRESLGAAAWLLKFDGSIDDATKKPEEYQTRHFICTYVDRPETLDKWCQNLLNACIYYNSPCYPENNLPVVQEYFVRNGYGGYLLYDIDSKTGKQKNNAGWMTGGLGGVKDDLLNLGADWVNIHSCREDHIEVLEEFTLLKNADDLKNRDLMMAVLGALRAERSLHIDRMKRFNKDKVDITGFYPL